MDSLENRIRAGAFHLFAQPDGNGEAEIANSLLAVIAAADEETSSRAYHRLLYAVGNNHAGTYFPVILPVLPFLCEILGSGGPWSARTAINVLIDWLASFCPDTGFERIETPDGEADLRSCVMDYAQAAILPVERIAQSDPMNRELALDLLDVFAPFREGRHRSGD